jgi:hypothetical protein
VNRSRTLGRNISRRSSVHHCRRLPQLEQAPTRIDQGPSGGTDNEHGGMTRENGQRFREMILAHAGTQDAAAMYRAFRGRDAEVEPLLRERGLKAAGRQ